MLPCCKVLLAMIEIYFISYFKVCMLHDLQREKKQAFNLSTNVAQTGKLRQSLQTAISQNVQFLVFHFIIIPLLRFCCSIRAPFTRLYWSGILWAQLLSLC